MTKITKEAEQKADREAFKQAYPHISDRLDTQDRNIAGLISSMERLFASHVHLTEMSKEVVDLRDEMRKYLEDILDVDISKWRNLGNFTELLTDLQSDFNRLSQYQSRTLLLYNNLEKRSGWKPEIYMWLLAFMSISTAALGFSFWNWLNK